MQRFPTRGLDEDTLEDNELLVNCDFIHSSIDK